MVQSLVGDDRDGYLWSAEKRGGRSPVPKEGPTKLQILLFGTIYSGIRMRRGAVRTGDELAGT